MIALGDTHRRMVEEIMFADHVMEEHVPWFSIMQDAMSAIPFPGWFLCWFIYQNGSMCCFFVNFILSIGAVSESVKIFFFHKVAHLLAHIPFSSLVFAICFKSNHKVMAIHCLSILREDIPQASLEFTFGMWVPFFALFETLHVLV
jgi:hypothetical protein